MENSLQVGDALARANSGGSNPTLGIRAVMEKSLAEHIRGLEQKLNALSSQMMEERDSHRCNQLESELRAVDTALAHYRRAFEIESRLPLRSHPSSTKYSTEETT